MYYVYILRCADSSLYCGIAADLKRRFRQHAGELAGGARYTAAHPPLRYEAAFGAPDRAAAQRLEYKLKRLSHSEKEQLISGGAFAGLEAEGFERLNIKNLI